MNSELSPYYIDLINLNIINKSKGWPLSESARLSIGTEATSFPS